MEKEVAREEMEGVDELDNEKEGIDEVEGLREVGEGVVEGQRIEKEPQRQSVIQFAPQFLNTSTEPSRKRSRIQGKQHFYIQNVDVNECFMSAVDVRAL